MTPSQLPQHLPSPDFQTQTHHLKVVNYLKELIHRSGGKIPFEQFMEICLYAPNLGYYAAGKDIFGKAGDFITAPELSPLFAKCLARRCADDLQNLENPVIIEYGAGSGIMATEILSELESLHALPQQYLIIEISESLRKRQRETIEKKCPHLLKKVYWQEKEPSLGYQGIILANEFLDALPIVIFQWNQKKLQELYVGCEKENFIFLFEQPRKNTQKEFQETVYPYIHNLDDYQSEINLHLEKHITNFYNFLKKGSIYLIDYGYPAETYYHPHRNRGTLMCHYQHYAHHDSLIFAGIQDITSHVNFTRVGEIAKKIGFQITEFNTQANFLLSSGISEIPVPCDEKERYIFNQQLKYLLMPQEMGEAFKVMKLLKQTS